MNKLMESIQNTLTKKITDGDLAKYITDNISVYLDNLVDKDEVKKEINESIKLYLEGKEAKPKKETKPKKQTKTTKKESKPKKQTKKEDSSEDDSSEEVKDFAKMKVSELKELLKEKGLNVSGKKADLIERLESAGKEVDSGSDEDSDIVSSEDDSVSSEDENSEEVPEKDSKAYKAKLTKMSVTQLKELCKRQELTTKGKKEDLIERLVEDYEDDPLDATTDESDDGSDEDSE